MAWFEQSGFAEGEYGLAETLSKAKNTSVAGMRSLSMKMRQSASEFSVAPAAARA